MGEINAMCTKSTMHELIFRGDRSGPVLISMWPASVVIKNEPSSNVPTK
ncbi:MAG: hypothetical protein ACI9XC_002122 [Gammaproteobacteria bacterium]|jgi:hypothetical protein